MTSSSKNILWFSFRQRHLNKYQPYFSNSSNHFSHSMITIKPKQINLSLLSRYIKSYWIYVKGNYDTHLLHTIWAHFQERSSQKYPLNFHNKIKILQWILWARKILKQKSPDAIIIWGGLQLHQAVLTILAKESNISVVFLENGFLPNTTQVDLEGANWLSSIKNIKPDDYNHLQLDEVKLAQLFDKEIIPREQRKSLSTTLNTKKSDELSHLPKEYLFLPFQVSKDSQIKLYSPWIPNMISLVESVSQALKIYNHSSEKPLTIVAKEHPSDFGRVNYAKHKAVWAEKGIHFANKIPTSELIEKASAIITINSSVGAEAILKMKSVILLGNAAYHQTQITQKASSVEELVQTIQNFEKFPNPEKLKYYLYYLYYKKLVQGHYKSLSRDHWESMERKLLELLTPNS